jgi:tetratricopeptide (TPR) repeat protein
VQKYDKPLSEATTSSLEALKALSLADLKHQMGQELAALPLYQRAVELDPNFAMAYARLGTVYTNLGQSQLSEQNRQKAFELRDRASEHEKLYIMSHYYADSGQLDKGITALELYKQTYPRDMTPYNNLAGVYNSLGQFENGLDNARQAVLLDPDSASGYSNLAVSYAGLNRLDEAKATLDQAVQRKLGASGIHLFLAALAWTQKDPEAMERELGLARVGPDGDMNFYGFQSAVAAAQGRLQQARELGQSYRQAAERLSLKEASAGELIQEAVMEAVFENKTRAREVAGQALQKSQSPNVMLAAAGTFALLGDEQKALKFAEDVAAQRPYDTLVQFVAVPLVKAQVELNHGNAAKAIDLLNGAMVYGRINTALLCVRGEAYLKAGQGGDAAQAFQRLLDLKNVFPLDTLMSVAQLGLARAYALQGDKAKSRIAYQDFFVGWKDADPDIPLLREAKAEYVKVL